MGEGEVGGGEVEGGGEKGRNQSKQTDVYFAHALEMRSSLKAGVDRCDMKVQSAHAPWPTPGAPCHVYAPPSPPPSYHLPPPRPSGPPPPRPLPFVDTALGLGRRQQIAAIFTARGRQLVRQGVLRVAATRGLPGCKGLWETGRRWGKNGSRGVRRGRGRWM